jgi:hypothetical protein
MKTLFILSMLTIHGQYFNDGNSAAALAIIAGLAILAAIVRDWHQKYKAKQITEDDL